MARRRTRTAGWARWLVLPLIAGAVWVNREPLRSLVGWRKDPAPVHGEAELFVPRESTPTAAAPFGQVMAVAPVSLLEVIEDPMLRATVEVSEEPKPNEESRVVLAPPAVSLILHGKHSRRALIEGEILGVGGRTRIGEIVRIEPDFVAVRATSGHERLLRLAEPRKLQDVTARASAGGPGTAAETRQVVGGKEGKRHDK